MIALLLHLENKFRTAPKLHFNGTAQIPIADGCIHTIKIYAKFV